MEHINMKDLKNLIKKLCDDMMKSVDLHEKTPCRRQGCFEGIELCRTLSSADEFESVIKSRRIAELGVDLRKGPIDIYWRHRCATSQLEYVFEVVKVAVGGYSPISARAAVRYRQLTSN